MSLIGRELLAAQPCWTELGWGLRQAEPDQGGAEDGPQRRERKWHRPPPLDF